MKSKYFKAHELVPSHIYAHYGDKSYRFIDSRLIETIDTIKEHFNLGTMTINNYAWNGDREWSGLRTPVSNWYSETSMHAHGKAIDAVFSDYSAEEVRNFIIENKNLFPHIKGIELGVSWLHIDTRNEDSLVLFNA